MIEVRFPNKSSQAANGARHWFGYVRDTLIKKMGDSAKLVKTEGNTSYIRCADTVAEFSLRIEGTDSPVVVITLDAKKADGSPVKTAPIPALVILMTVIHLLPGAQQAGRLTRLSGVIGDTKFENMNDLATVKRLYSSLKNLCPEPWYLPYAEGVQDPTTFFANLKK